MWPSPCSSPSKQISLHFLCARLACSPRHAVRTSSTMPLLLQLPGVALISQFLVSLCTGTGLWSRHQGGSKGGPEAWDFSRGVWHLPTECIHRRARTNTFVKYRVGTTTTTSPLSSSPLPPTPFSPSSAPPPLPFLPKSCPGCCSKEQKSSHGHVARVV